MNPTCVIGLDPGLDTGIAILSGPKVHANSWALRASDAPLLLLHRRLLNLLEVHAPALVCYEEPVARGHAARSLNRQLGVIILTCELAGVAHYPVNPSTLKRHATGRGNADKAAMLAAIPPDWADVCDHNAVDALWLADYGRRVVLPSIV